MFAAVRVTFLLAGLITGVLCPPVLQAIDAVPSYCQEVLHDTAFSEGFGAAFIYGKRDAEGIVRSYRDIAPWQIHLIPEGPVNLDAFQTHPCDFQEGYHENYTNKHGEKIRELHTHRLVVNHVVEVNTLEKLQFAQFNNEGRAKEDVLWNTRLVKRVTTNHCGKVRLYYNSQNESRNAAINHTAEWARDTWPHFLLNQGLEQPIPLAYHPR